MTPEGTETCKLIEFSAFLINNVSVLFPFLAYLPSRDQVDVFLFFILLYDWLIFLENHLDFLSWDFFSHVFTHLHEEIIKHQDLAWWKFFFDTTVIFDVGTHFLKLGSELFVELFVNLSFVVALLNELFLIGNQWMCSFGSLDSFHDFRVGDFNLFFQVRLG